MVVKLSEERIKDVDDLSMVDKYFLNQVKYNLKRPVVQINVGGAMITMPDFRFGEKSQVRL